MESATGYHRFRPRPDLNPWLATLWVQQSPAVEAPPTTVLPNGQVELVVRFGDPFVHLEEGRTVTVPAAAVLGQRTRPIAVAATGTTGLVIAGLHPWAGDALLGDDVGVVTDGMVDLSQVIGRARVASLQDRVASAAGAEDRARAVEGFLATLFRRHEPDPLAATCARWINEGWGGVPMDLIAREVGVSGRQLRRCFTRAVGIGPKRLSRLVRAQKAIGALRRGLSWPQVVARCRYVDQAHLTREIKAFAGRTPGELARPAPETALMRSFNRRGLTGFSNTIYL